MVRVRPGAGFTARDLAAHLHQEKIGNRMLFGGNLTRQPVFVGLRRERPGSFRVAFALEGADEIMNQGLFLGTYPGLSPAMLDHVTGVIRKFCGCR